MIGNLGYHIDTLLTSEVSTRNPGVETISGKPSVWRQERLSRLSHNLD
jgi:hypothetical protein